MANIKHYRVADVLSDIELRLQVDRDKLTPKVAAEINGFFIDDAYRLEAADGDVVLAVIRLAAANFINDMLRGEPIEWAQRGLDQSEGWLCDHGITLVDCDGLPEIDSAELVVDEVES